MEFESVMVWQQLPADIGIDPKQSIYTLYGIVNELRNKHIPMFRMRRFFPKPWRNRMCSEAWRHLERCYRTFKTIGNIEDRIKWKKARANATRTFREEKKKEWHSYVDTLTINTKASLEKNRKFSWETSFKGQYAKRE